MLKTYQFLLISFILNAIGIFLVVSASYDLGIFLFEISIQSKLVLVINYLFEVV